MASRAFQILIFLLVLTVPLAAADAPPSPEGIEFFEKRIRPVLVTQCYNCHSATSKTVMGGLWVDSREGLRKGGSSGTPSVVPGDPNAGLLIRALRHADAKLKMPPGKPLADEVVRDFEEWVKMGAPDPRTGSVTERPAYDYTKARRHWSLQPVRDVEPPVVKDAAWSHTAIDRFVKARLEAQNLRPLPPASKRELLRRVTYDLTGLPPTPEEMQSFVRDTTPNAFTKVVDRLLASPHYGEKWGRRWLDVVRYADTAGDNSDYPVPSAYRYRNYVIDSFNADKPYDRFVKEQVAGDLLAYRDEEDRREKLVATGYLAQSRRFGSRNNEFHLTIEDSIDNLGKAFLGLSVSCARCHDHKFDPIPNRDFYAFFGIFQGTKYAFPGTEIYPKTKDFVPLGSPEEVARLRKYEEAASGLDNRIEDLKAGKLGKMTPEEKERELQVAHGQMRQWEERFPDVPKAYGVAEGTPGNARIHRKGDPKALGEEVPRGFLTVLGGQTLPPDEKGSGRRQLAEWIVDAQNPLTARVMVNRIWQGHFGRGLVRTPNDFGIRGEVPTHPELLDWLAVRFRESGYSVKAMHRLMLLTRTYQTASGHDEKNALADARNDLLWRFDRRRLDAEEIRDAMLASSGALDRSRGGEHPFPPEPRWRYTQHKAFFAVYDTPKRSVYVMQQRMRKHPWFEAFDGADTNATTAVRNASTTSLQALTLMNDPFVHEQADKLAVRVGMASPTEAGRVTQAYSLLFQRRPTPAETTALLGHVRQAGQALRETGVEPEQRSRQAWASALRVLLASNEFLFVD